MSARRGLSDDVKTAIVQALACYEMPSDVVRLIREDFDVEVSRQAVETYDPTKHAGAALSPAYRAIFEATRDRYLSEAGKIGIAHQPVRLRNLQRLAGKAEAAGNLALAASITEQAAKEIGGFYARHRPQGRRMSGNEWVPESIGRAG